MNTPGMDMGSGSAASNTSASSSTMTMTVAFQNDIATPLYSMSWTPRSAGTYAATCIFLVVLAVLLRALFAVKAVQESRWLDQELNRRYVVVDGQLPLHDKASHSSLRRSMVLSANGVEEQVMVVQKTQTHVRPWRASVDPLRAAIDTAIAAVAYLLMLAIMTMNVGYFLSILGGTFLGSLAIGRFATSAGH